MFTTHDIKSLIKTRADELIKILVRQQQDVAVTRTDSRIVRAIEWLLANQRTNGAWGNNNVACTSIVMIALSNVLEPTGYWGIAEKVSNAIVKGGEFLLEIYRLNSYENAVWDTAVAVRALNRSKEHPRSFISDRIAWLLSISPATLNAGPHHLAQSTLVFAECGVQSHKVQEAANQTLESLQKGRFQYSPYVLAQCLEAVQVGQVDTNVDPIVQKLMSFLEATHLDSANFINICSSLNALYPLMNVGIEKRMRLSIASLFGETCFRYNGTWYQDEMSTAYALIALTRFSKEVVIRAPKSEIIYEVNSLFDDLFKSAATLSRHNWRSLIIHLLNAFLCGGMLAFFITYTTIKSTFPEWLIWVLTSLISLSFGFSIRYLYKFYRGIYDNFGN